MSRLRRRRISGHEEHERLGRTPVSVEATHRNGAAARDGLATARMLARPGIAVAASAPIALVALSYIPTYRPPDMAACVLSVVATAILVLAAELACFAPGDRPARPDGREANLDSWSDSGHGERRAVACSLARRCWRQRGFLVGGQGRRCGPSLPARLHRCGSAL